ncbi:beta-lactamase family protein [Streptomyces sp. ISL-12]|uniref:serine hydrolase domain-containing protein n=1 Tax=Streptomyces sp. ISL-12 TaxID=2819177 RepID=UPI001BE5BAF7|nr:serine hydrolase domain-containing protein [Streptomyces sp. ISL-12]MBT2411653.1 beta-lactamase family protein [Streptomyces sp. ISL-12]
MDSDAVRGVERRQLVGWGGLAAAGAVAAGTALVGARPGHAAPAPSGPGIPPDTRPGGAYDRYVAELAAEDKFSGVVLLSHRGRTVLSRSYGMADREKGIRNHEDVAVNLASGIQPFLSVAVLRLAQQGKVSLSDTVGAHLTGFADDIAGQVTLHHLLTGTSGLSAPAPDPRRVFRSREEVSEFHRQWTRQAKLEAAPGTGSQAHTDGAGAGLAIAAQIVEAVTGTTYWDYVHEHVFGRAGMHGSAFYTRPQWLTDEHIAHSYMRQADGSRVDAVRNLDKGSTSPDIPGKNPGRAFIGYAGGDGFATAPDLVRFAHALRDGTVLDRPFADLLTGAKLPQAARGDGAAPAHPSFMAYAMPVKIINGQWVIGRGGATGGSAANWNIYPDTGWVGVVLSNYDDVPLQEILDRETQAVTGSR